MKELLWASPEFAAELEAELSAKRVAVLDRRDHLFLVENAPAALVWCEARGRRAEVLNFQSITDAQNALKKHGRLWCDTSVSHFRRSELIAQGLRVLSPRLRKAFEPVPAGPLGAYALTDEHELWMTPELVPAVPPLSWNFEESKVAPSRAYLKLWELFTRQGFRPQAGETCLELGSAPGGWTWVLAGLGCKVIAVDKGEMDAKLTANPRVKWLRKDAFARDLPEAVGGSVDWLFSDLICYPKDLLALVTEWRAKGLARHFVCTVKFQGETDTASLDQLLRIPGSYALHLQHNKHEVTWVCLQTNVETATLKIP
ncbi:MAG: hypothetical protein LCH90_10360 [Proteobacteria bacterium]|nr:hypothetical protein [Pseudomonadota bacterium]